MKITKQLRDWLVSKSLIAADADDAAVKTATSQALVADEQSANHLSAEKYAELQVTEAVKAASVIEDKFDRLFKGMEALTTAASKAPVQQTVDVAPAHERAGGASYLEKAFAKAPDIKVKGAWDQYATTKSAALYPREMTLPNGGGRPHPLADMQVRSYESPIGGGIVGGLPRLIDVPSQLDKACIGAVGRWMLHCASKGTGFEIPMREHEWQLVQYALHELSWGGIIKNGQMKAEGSEDQGTIELKGDRKLKDFEIKALIDDATSGGLEAAPIVFDDAVILTPILYGELFPGVTVVPITRGRRIEGVQVGNPTVNSGGADDTDITLFNTAGLVTAFDTSIYVVDMGIEIGLDFLSDSPIAFEQIFTNIFGMQLMQYLDRVIAVGNGTTEPEGVMNASGSTSVSFGGVAPTIGGYESLRFGVQKRYKQGFSPDRIVFCGTETSYMRARAIAVGASDARRLFGDGYMGVGGYGNYQLMEHRWAVNENMTNAQQFYAVLPRYRMYRRAGLQLKMTTEGKTLTRRNLMLITGRARFGGQLEDGGAAALTTTAQA